MRKLILMTSAFVFGFTACNSEATSENSKTTSSEASESVHATNSISPATVEVIQSDASAPVLDAYFAMKTVLQEDNSASTAEAATQLVASLNMLEPHSEANVKTLAESIKVHSEHIAQSEIEQQRAHFEALSHDLKSLVVLVGSDRVIYEQYCPMYADDNGGMWLSDEKELFNPLFGSSMLRCGTTNLEILPKSL